MIDLELIVWSHAEQIGGELMAQQIKDLLPDPRFHAIVDEAVDSFVRSHEAERRRHRAKVLPGIATHQPLVSHAAASPKPVKRTNNMSPENRTKAAERMRDYHRKKREQAGQAGE